VLGSRKKCNKLVGGGLLVCPWVWVPVFDTLTALITSNPSQRHRLSLRGSRSVVEPPPSVYVKACEKC